jgi:hypothetical protein
MMMMIIIIIKRRRRRRIRGTTSQNRVLLEKVMATKLVKEFPILYGTRRFVAMFTRRATGAHPEPNESSSNPHTTATTTVAIIIIMFQPIKLVQAMKLLVWIRGVLNLNL